MDQKSLSDIWRLLQCPQCLQCPMTPPIYMCESGHHMCSNCSSRDRLQQDHAYSSDSDNAERDVPCFHCGERMTLMRNIFCEQLIKVVSYCSSMPDVRCVPMEPKQSGVYRTMVFERKPSSYTSIPDRQAAPLPGEQTREEQTTAAQGDHRDKAQTSHPHLARKSSTTNIYRSGSFDTRSSGSYASASNSDVSLFPTKRKTPTNHMPIRCPKIPCGRTVASSGLILHFQFDHKDVPHIDMGLNDELNVWITPTVIPFEIERCLALLLLQADGSTSQQVVNANIDQHKNRSPFILMGTRLPCHLNTNMQLHRNALTDFPMNSECLINDFLLIWLIGMDSEQFSCKIVATDVKDPSKSLTYVGPIMSVRDIFSPREVLATGNCIMLPPGYVNVLTESGGGFDLNVTIV